MDLQTTLIILVVFKIMALIGLYGIFKKAGVKGWKAFVPFLNVFEWLKLIGKPSWWIILLCIPIVNIFYMAYMLIGMSKAFKHYDLGNHVAAVLFYFVYLPYLGFSKKETYYGPDGLLPGQFHPDVSSTRGWIDSIVFALVAAHLIRLFFIEAYKIPTSSMESTLQIGDYMFVSKLNYGARLPNTPLSFPLVHHTLPRTKARAYSELFKWDYVRLPGFEKVKRDDIIVFNVPFEYDMQSDFSKTYSIPRNVKYKSRPVDKREHYIKRVVGIAGDSLQIKNNTLFINGQEARTPEHIQFNYTGELKKPISRDDLRNYGIRAYTNNYNGSTNPVLQGNRIMVNANPESIVELKKDPRVAEIAITDMSKRMASFPKDANKKGWSIVDYGPIWIPKKGETITLTPENIVTYYEAIAIHEHNDLELKNNGTILINGIETNQYTFQMDYYFLMGDNRHASLDSRDWGFVPDDHVAGKPLFIFWSMQGGPGNPGLRTNRILQPAQDMN